MYITRWGAWRWKRIVPKKRNVLWKQDDFFHGVPKFQAISSTSHENCCQCHFHVDMIKMFMTKINNQQDKGHVWLFVHIFSILLRFGASYIRSSAERQRGILFQHVSWIRKTSYLTNIKRLNVVKYIRFYEYVDRWSGRSTEKIAE